jgi:hypothetical protein
MGLLSFLKHKLRRRRKAKGTTRQTNFRDYQNSRRKTDRKPFVPKKTRIAPITRSQKQSRRKQARILVALKILAAILILLALSYLVLFTRTFEIQKIDVRGDENTLDEQAQVSEYLQDFLGENLVFFNTISHEGTLLANYPYLKDLNLNRLPLHTLVAELVTYEHAANVQIEYENGSQQDFIVNELGYIAASGKTEDTLPTIIMDVTGTEIDLSKTESTSTESSSDSESDSSETTTKTSSDPTLNQELIPQDTLETLLEAKIDFEGKFNMQILELEYQKRARELHLLTERYFYVWIDLTQDVDRQLAKLKKSMTELNIYEEDLQYIDLRISGQNGEKVIYRVSTAE